MAKATSRFVCQSCGEAFLRWEGQCRTCGAWNSLVETVVRDTPEDGSHRPRTRWGADGIRGPRRHRGARHPAPARPGIGELDRVLGGGIVPGSLILLGGEPGIGKSTLLLQVAAGVAAPVLYATGEESAAQVRLRAGRLDLLAGPSGQAIEVLAEHDIGRIIEVGPGRSPGPGHRRLDPDGDGRRARRGRGQRRAGPRGGVRLMEFAKGEGIAVVLVGHVTKDGSLAGPKTLEHLVDAVIALEGERYAALRLVRAAKNRFGSTEEVGVFEMAGTGLREVSDPARAFLADHAEPAPGSVVAPTLEGSRPLLVEVQALVAAAAYGNPARKASGIDPNRLGLLVAVLGKRAGVGLASHDVYANLAGGLSVAEPGLDLPVALALASSLRERPIVPGTVVVGEVGLLGELRAVTGLERRLREAARLGFTAAIVPRPGRGAEPLTVPGLRIVEVATLRDAVQAALASGADRRGDAVPAMLG